MESSAKSTTDRPEDQPVHKGYQWGEPLDDEERLRVERVGDELEITAAMPGYLSRNHPCDFVRQYEIAHKYCSIGKQTTGKDSPHIRFANADSDDELIDFVRCFGPVVAKNWEWLGPPDFPWKVGDPPLQTWMRAQQDLQELRSEQGIYKAALGLVVALSKKDVEFMIDAANHHMVQIARGVRDWPRQWNREKKNRGTNPLWRVRRDSVRQITALPNSRRDRFLPPELDARTVLCELVNAFPPLAFPNPLAMHAYIRFGIRPLLYAVLRHEFLQPRDVGVCANTQCRDFFEVERAGQRFCNELCSRRQRQREYWQLRGKAARRERLAAPIKGRLR